MDWSTTPTDPTPSRPRWSPAATSRWKSMGNSSVPRSGEIRWDFRGFLNGRCSDFQLGWIMGFFVDFCWMGWMGWTSMEMFCASNKSHLQTKKPLGFQPQVCILFGRFFRMLGRADVCIEQPVSSLESALRQRPKIGPWQSVRMCKMKVAISRQLAHNKSKLGGWAQASQTHPGGWIWHSDPVRLPLVLL